MAFCDECLHKGLEFTRSIVPEWCLSDKGFVREQGTCLQCQTARVTARAPQ
jgi:hypothetical protein